MLGSGEWDGEEVPLWILRLGLRVGLNGTGLEGTFDWSVFCVMD